LLYIWIFLEISFENIGFTITMKKLFRIFVRNNWATVVLFISSWGLGFIGYLTYFNTYSIQNASVLDALYLSMKLFAIDGGFPINPVPVTLNIARFLAPATLAWAAIKTVIWFARDQLKIIRLSNYSEHTIICGPGLSENYLVREMMTNNKKTVIIGDRKNMAPDELNHPHMIYLEGSGNNEDKLEQARLAKSKYLLCLNVDDQINVSTALLANKIVSTAKNPARVTAFCHISNPRSINQIQTLDYFKDTSLDKNLDKQFYLQLFNIYERAARIIMRDFSPDRFFSYNQPDAQQPHIIVAGLSWLGEAVIIQAARMGHFINMKKLKVTVVDNNENRFQELMNAYPMLPETIDIQHVVSLDKAPESVDEPAPPQMIYVCSENAVYSLELITQTDRFVADHGAHIVICLNHKNSFLNNLSGDQIHHFDLKQNTLTYNAIIKEDIDELAHIIHEDYLKEQKLHKTHNPSKPSHREWEFLPEFFKNQNRSQADHLMVKVRTAGCSVKPKNAPETAFAIHEYDALIEKLAEMEHNRWNAHMLISGWKHGPERDDRRKIHPDIVPYEKLSEETKGYDRVPVKNIPKLLDVSGLKIVKE